MDHMTQMYRDAEKLVDDPKEVARLNKVIAALDSIIRNDQCPVLRAACRARYLEITDGKPIA
jgi:hypothetical protein